MKKYYLLASFIVIIISSAFILRYESKLKNNSSRGTVLRNDTLTLDEFDSKSNDTLYHDETIEIDRDIIEFEEMKKQLVNGNYESFIDGYVNFPLEGDIVFYQCYGESVFENGIDFYKDSLTNLVFLENFNVIFDSTMIRLISMTDIEQLIINNEEYRQKLKVSPFEELYTVAYRGNKEYRIDFVYKDSQESINDHNTIFLFKRIENKLKLYKIYGAG